MKASSYSARVLVFFALLATSAISQTSELRDDLARSFTKFDVVRINRASGNRLSIPANGRVYELVVEPHDLRPPHDTAAEDTNMVGVKTLERAPIATYKGKILGEESSEVRLTIDGSRIEGFFGSGSQRFFIEPAAKYSTHAEADLSVVYQAQDSLVDSPLLCESDIPTKIEHARELAGTDRAERIGTLRVLELATEADLSYVNTLGGAAAANNEILGILNMIEGTYNAELNVTIQVVYQHTWSTADPFNGADLAAIFAAFVNYWNANNGAIPRDTAHLFSAKPAVLSRGTAYIGTVCRAPANAYGISGFVSWVPGKFLVPAHEIGHNLGADHADAAQGCANSIMNTQLSGYDTALVLRVFAQPDLVTHFATRRLSF